MKGYMEQAAAFCYHHSDYNYIVPEGVIMHPSERFWFRNSDLGNLVQQSEIVKAGRLLIGLDDLNPEKGLTVIPRLPSDWKTIEVKDYPVVAVDKSGKPLRTRVNYQYKRIENGYELSLETDSPIRLGQIRIGPFSTKNIKITEGKMPYMAKQIRDQNFIYFDLTAQQGKTFTIKATSSN